MAFHFLSGGGEMGALMRSHDWSASSLGSPETWPSALKTTVRVLLTSNHPMFIFWGKDFIQFYNDAYRQTMGPERHPGALGQKGKECWKEVWDLIGPDVEQVLTGNGSVWHQERLVPVTRHGQRENVWWTYGYSPIEDESGVHGVLVVCNDVTESYANKLALSERNRELDAEVKARRQAQECLAHERDRIDAALVESRRELAQQALDWQKLHAMSTRLLQARTLREQFDAVRETVLDFHQSAQGAISLFDAEKGGLATQASMGISSQGLEVLKCVGPGADACGLAYRDMRRIVIEDTETDPVYKPYLDFARQEDIRALYSTPFFRLSGEPLGVLSVYFPASRRPTEREMRLVDICIGQIALFVEREYGERKLHEEQERSHQILQSLKDGFVLLDRDFRVIQINAEGLKIEGRQASEILGKVHWDAWPGSEDMPIGKAYKQAMAERRLVQLEQCHHIYGYEAWFDVRAYPYGDGIAILYRDITEKKRTENELKRITDEAERRRRLYEAFLQNSPDFAYVFDLNHRFTYVNEILLKTWGKTRDEAIGKNCLELGYEPWHAEMHGREIEQVRASKQPVKGEVPFNGTFGRRIYEYIFVPVIGPDGEVEAVAGTTRDVTERQQTEQALQHSQAHLLSVFEQTAAGICECDLDGVILNVNQQYCRIIGRSEKELIGKTMQEITHPEDLPENLKLFTRLPQTGETFEIEKRYLRPDGSSVWANVSVSLIRSPEENSRDTVLAVVLDATERKRTEEALRDETRILEILNQSGQKLASTLDTQPLLQSLTDAATELCGAKFGSFFYNHTDEQGDSYLLYTLCGAPREAFDKFGKPRATALFGPTFQGHPPIRSDDILKDERYGKSAPHHGMPQGHLPVRSYLAVPVKSRSGEVIGGLFFGHPETCVFTERTERIITAFAAQAGIALDNARLYELSQRSAEERESLLNRERAARGEAERLSKLKDEFLAMLAHELRNPLAPINTAAELLKLASLDQDGIRRTSDIITRQVAHMTGLVNDLLDMSRVTRGLVTLQHETLNLETIAADAVEQVRPLMQSKHQHLTMEVASDSMLLRGDRTRLTQIIANILNNAAKYTPAHGHVSLRLNAQPGEVEVCVEDDGIGIGPELLPHVFDLFTQGERSSDRSQGGLGLGLALVKSLAALHGGKVSAYSAGKGKGSCFTVSFPSVARASESGRDGTFIGSGTQSKSLNVIVIDDNVDAAATLSMMLETMGHRVVVGHSAQFALERGRQIVPDIFFLDIGLPEMDGYELARRFRSMPETANSMLVAVTGYGQPEDRERSAKAGFDHHLVKPVKLDELLKLLSHASAAQTLDARLP
ncbi:MAG: PAS domain S-box protein [Burkholderiaceae bacterium]